MNELICKMTDEQMQGLYEMAEIGINEKAYNIEELEHMSPIVRPRQDVICLGINYDEHAKEAGMYSEEAFGGERPYTIYFSKRVNKATGPKEGIPSYEGIVDSLDYESELGVILKKDVKGISKEEAMDAVFGYTVINDVSARNLQTRHKQWYVGKSMDGFTPMGPCIVTADEIEDVQNLEIKSYVNGELRQNSNTKYMIQSVAGAISELSLGMTLQAGTIIATGTPAGVGMGMKPPCFLNKGDVVVCEIEKIGKIENEIV
jgi:2-keto-4-pentenoate hydratase/2-oxohepta-3-ene-1,7-dioic acid hydratase in catechol pathway